MNAFTLSPQFNKNKVFILHKSELDKRLDSHFYKIEFQENAERIKKEKHKRLSELVMFSNETWNQQDYFDSTFPYIEISEIDTQTGEILNVSLVDKDKAPSRAKMIVRENDIIVSTTRPHRGAISFIDKNKDFSIASTGFSVIRQITSIEISREYLFTAIRQQFALMQLLQRSSGGNYPAITQDELGNILIPLPPKEKQEIAVNILQKSFEQKKQNEAKAEKLLAGIDDYLLKELGITLPPPLEDSLKNRMFTSQLKELSGNRFDPFYHQKYFVDIDNAIRKSKYKTDILKHQLSFIESGSRPPGGVSNIEEGILSFGGEHVNNLCEVEVKTPKYISTEFHKLNIATETKLSDILIVKDGATTGKVGIINNPDYCGQNINEHVFLLRPINTVNAVYLVNYLNFSPIQTLIKQIITGATVTGITKDALKTLPVVLPPLSKQKEIAERITAIRQQAQQLKDKTKSALEQASKEIEEILLGG